jgi:hypothetical protein
MQLKMLRNMISATRSVQVPGKSLGIVLITSDPHLRAVYMFVLIELGQ